MTEMIYISMEGIYYFMRIVLCFQLLSLGRAAKRKHPGWVAIGSAGILAMLHALNVKITMHAFSNAELLLIMIFTAFTVFYLFTGELKEIFCIVWFYYVISQLFDFFLITILLFFMGTQIVEATIFRSVYLMFIVALLVIGYFIIKKMVVKMHDLHITWQVLLLIDLLGSASIIFFQRVYLEEITHYLVTAWKKFFFYTIILLALLVGYECWQRRRQKYKMLELKNMMLEENYNNILSIYRENARLFHDSRAHLNVMKNYLQQHEIEKCTDYLDEILKPSKNLANYVWTDNEIIDLILNHKRQEAIKKGSQIWIETDQIGHVDIPEIDLCSIFSNLIDNAIENCALDKNIIKLSLKKRNEILILVIKNHMKSDCIAKNGKLVTRKEDKSLHGVGIESVKHSVYKNGGSFEYLIENNCFKVIVTLSL